MKGISRMGMKEIIRFHAVAYSKASINKKTAIIDGIVAATNMNRRMMQSLRGLQIR